MKSDTAAENIATSAGKLFCVSLNICSAVSTFIKFISLSAFKLVGPDISVVSNPFFDSDLANSKPCFPLDLLVINLTGSIYSRVGPAVTKALNFLFLFKLKNNFQFV